MNRSEYIAHASLAAQAEERARWSAVLARPTDRPVRKPAKPAGLLARISALFA